MLEPYVAMFKKTFILALSISIVATIAQHILNAIVSTLIPYPSKLPYHLFDAAATNANLLFLVILLAHFLKRFIFPRWVMLTAAMSIIFDILYSATLPDYLFNSWSFTLGLIIPTLTFSFIYTTSSESPE